MQELYLISLIGLLQAGQSSQHDISLAHMLNVKFTKRKVSILLPIFPSSTARTAHLRIIADIDKDFDEALESSAKRLVDILKMARIHAFRDAWIDRKVRQSIISMSFCNIWTIG